MLAEIIFSYYIQSNLSSHLNVGKPPYIDSEVRLNVEHDFTPRWNLKLSPYVIAADRMARIAGTEFELNYSPKKNISIGYHHHSSHNLDENGMGLNMDGIRLKWRFH